MGEYAGVTSLIFLGGRILPPTRTGSVDAGIGGGAVSTTIGPTLPITPITLDAFASGSVTIHDSRWMVSGATTGAALESASTIGFATSVRAGAGGGGAGGGGGATNDAVS